MSIADQRIVIVCRTQDEPIDVIEACNVMGIGWTDGEPARYFAPIHTSQPYSIVLNQGTIGYCRFKDVPSMVAQGYTQTTPKEFVTACNAWIVTHESQLPAEERTAWHAFDVRRDRDGVYDD